MDASSVAEMVLRLGESVTVTRASSTASVKAKIREGVPEGYVGDRHLAEFRLTIAAADPGWTGWTSVPPIAGDKVTFQGRAMLVSGVRIARIGEDAALYVLTTRG